MSSTRRQPRHGAADNVADHEVEEPVRVEVRHCEAGDTRPLDAVEAKWIVDPAQGFSKSRNTPFKGWELPGVVVRVLVGGRVVFER